MLSQTNLEISFTVRQQEKNDLLRHVHKRTHNKHTPEDLAHSVTAQDPFLTIFNDQIYFSLLTKNPPLMLSQSAATL